jgi:phosphatidate cytidylyltransferase
VSEQKTPPQAAGVKPESSNLWMRVLAAAVMAPLAILLAWAGGWFWAALATLAAIGMYVEWLAIVGVAQRSRLAASGVAALLIAGICLALERQDGALVVYGIGLVAVALLTRGDRRWPVSGLFYAAAAQMAAVLVRQDPVWGWSALLFVMLIVWATDIGGYFAGRAIGGPKLWVRVSPKKTWAGAVGGLTGSLIVAAGFAASGIGRMASMLLLAAVLSVVSQLGDLFESAVKRRFGVKDSSHLIPGHGGVLDRIDGFVAAIVLAAIIGVLRGGADGVARGLMVW